MCNCVHNYINIIILCLFRFIKMFDKYDVKKKLKIKLKSPGELQVYKILLSPVTDLYYYYRMY